jgi:ribosomal-protein-alanine N-acetyltransferase
VEGADAIRIDRVTGGADLDQVCALEAESFTNPWTREMLERELRHSDVARVYVLRLADGTIAAFCTCWIIFDELHVNTIAVSPARRRQGLGMRLMRHVLAAATRAGAERATLEVRRSNLAAIRLYEQLGFRVTAVRPRYYTKPEEDALILWRHGLDAAEPPIFPSSPPPDTKP